MRRTASVLHSSSMAFVVLVGCLFTKDAGAQAGGVCVVNTQIIHIQCYSGCGKNGCSCSGALDIKVPSGGYGGGVTYQMKEGKCCDNPISFLGEPDGQCSVHAPVRKPTIAENRFIFVRGCDGRFRLYSVAG